MENENIVAALCPVCHQPVKPEYYFCPNCGAKLSEPPLSTSAGAQARLYIFSIVLPVICFIAVTKWKGYKYFKSTDQKTKKIGMIAWALLIISTVATFWFATLWIQNQVQNSIDAVNAELNAY